MAFFLLRKAKATKRPHGRLKRVRHAPRQEHSQRRLWEEDQSLQVGSVLVKPTAFLEDDRSSFHLDADILTCLGHAASVYEERIDIPKARLLARRQAEKHEQQQQQQKKGRIGSSCECDDAMTQVVTTSGDSEEDDDEDDGDDSSSVETTTAATATAAAAEATIGSTRLAVTWSLHPWLAMKVWNNQVMRLRLL